MLTMKIYVPEATAPQDQILQFIMRLYSNDLKCFGEPIIATIQMDSIAYSEARAATIRNRVLDPLLNRCTDLLDEVTLYQSAHVDWASGRGTFQQNLAKLQAAERGQVPGRPVV